MPSGELSRMVYFRMIVYIQVPEFRLLVLGLPCGHRRSPCARLLACESALWTPGSAADFLH